MSFELDKVKAFKEKIEGVAESFGLSRNIKDFMEYKEKPTQYVPTIYKYLFSAPKVFLANSKSFRKMYEQLDRDFALDLIDPGELKNMKVRIFIDNELREGLKEIMAEDSMY